jgi:RHH-type proline utilization regulon transcriptional repressor/proline dehydrogenase/delta 1-pyrroline-5-carboxylate dehydrogenase
MPALIASADWSAEQQSRVTAQTRQLVLASRRRVGVQSVLGQLALDSPAGLALLSLAEALLRVPDAFNADRLIRDQLALLAQSHADMQGPVAWALRCASALAGTAGPAGSSESAGNPIRRALIDAPLRGAMRAVMRRLGGQFIFATSIESALRRARRMSSPTARYSFDMLGEAALTDEDAQRYQAAYAQAIRAAGAASQTPGILNRYGISVKLSALHPRYGYAQRSRVLRELLPRLLELARLAHACGIPLTLDAEEAERLELSLELFDALAHEPILIDWAGLGIAVQAYQKRAPAVIDYLAMLARERRHPLLVRLVKGAYWDLEIKQTQQQGLVDYPVYTRKPYTDVAWLSCARRLLQSAGRLAPQFATHNARSVAEVLELIRASDVAVEFQRLYGMGEPLYRAVGAITHAPPVRIYAPVGDHAALLPYLMRRLLENGASSSYVHRTTRAPLEQLCADPLRIARRLGGRPDSRIPAPARLYGPQRRNSRGLDLEDPQQRALLERAVEMGRRTPLLVQPMLAHPQPAVDGSTSRPIRNPADQSDWVGSVVEADERAVQQALQNAQEGARRWAQTPIEMRAQRLEAAAEAFERETPALMARIVREAGRTLASGVGEVREAVDALRYYAAQIRSEFHGTQHVPLGPVVCISPWNFPLAIFTGQVAAALAAGNAVLAKPAEQTAATAALAVQLLHSAGIDPAALQLLPGGGQRVGLALAGDARVRGVLFTGSTGAARQISRTLAMRGQVPLIAETGGQNAMVVDSSALPEQVVADVLRSAFDSAGQRCSSLRVLCLQEEIASPVLTMLQGAMRELQVGDPADIATDVGPLIDEAARGRIQAHLAAMHARIRCQTDLPGACARGVFVPPTLVELQQLGELHGEVFGPVLHYLRFDRARLDELLEQINATGYGLTLGIASRIRSTSEHIIERVRAGNVYVNRNMIGAVIGVQPFGGEGLSGTGPKAGGPLYLHALLAHAPAPGLPGARRAGVPPLLGQLIEWLQREAGTLPASERERLRVRAGRYAQDTLLEARLPLPGYTGESNELRLRARGTLRATAQTLTALIEQLAAALATGNRLCVDAPELATRLSSALPPALGAQLIRHPAPCQTVLVDAREASEREDWFSSLRRAVAEQNGPIVPVILSDAERGYPLERLLVEQTISINTAAVGGDARLLALQEQPDDSNEPPCAGVSG